MAMAGNDDQCYSNDFEKISESIATLYEESNSLPHNVDSESATDEEARLSSDRIQSIPQEQLRTRIRPESSRKKMDLSDMHLKREIQWANEKETLLQEIEDLKMQLEKYTTDEKQCKLAVEYTETQSKITMLQSEFDCLQSKYGDAQNNLGSAAKMHEQLQIEYEKLKDEKEKLEESIKMEESRLEEAFKGKTNDIKTLSVAYEESKSGYKEMQFQYEKLKDEKESMESQIIELEESLQGKTNAVDMLSVELEKGKLSYSELRGIVNMFEKEQGELKATLSDKEEEMKKFQDIHECVKKELDGMEKKQCRQLQDERDSQDDQLIQMRLEFTRLENEKMEKFKAEMEKLTSTVKMLTEEDEGLKKQYEIESRNISDAMDALNNETNILRQRLEQLQFENSALESGKNQLESEKDELMKEMSRLTEKQKSESRPTKQRSATRQKSRAPTSTPTTSSPPGKSTPGHSRPDQPRPDYTTPPPKSRVTSHQENSSKGKEERQPNFQQSPEEQWYNSHDGEEILQEIYNQLKEILSPTSTVEISRDVTTKNITMVVMRDGVMVATIMFPRDFPNVSLCVRLATRRSMVEFPAYNSMSRPAQFARKVVSKLIGMILS